MRRIFKISGYLFLGFSLVLTLALAYFVYDCFEDLPSTSKLDDYSPSLITKLYDTNGEVFQRYFIERRVVVPLEKIPKNLLDALIAVEDTNFYKHKGISIRGIFRALLANLMAGHKVEGASTITQQLARGLFLTSDRVYKRKVKEILLALQIEHKYSKDEILTLYLNQIYFGHGVYGVEEAANYYFGKPVKSLNLEECALIAGLPKAPNNYSPYRNPEKAQARRGIVLNRMAVCGYITEEEAKKASEKPFKLKKFHAPPNTAPYFAEYVRQQIVERLGEDALYHDGLQVHTTLDIPLQIAAQVALKNGLKNLNEEMGIYKSYNDIFTWEEIMASYAANNINNQVDLLSTLVSGKEVWGEVAKVSTDQVSVNLGFELVATVPKEKLGWIKKIIAQNRKKGDLYGAYYYIPVEKLADAFKVGDIVRLKIENVGKTRITADLLKREVVQGALVAINPKNGHIKALVGGYDFKESPFNRAVQARRQPGSAFKPFIYAAALDSGFTPASLVVDAPLIYPESIKTEKGLEDWKPQNFYQRFYGPTTLRYALAHSLNIVAIKLLEQVGIPKAIQYARKMGIDSPLSNNLTLALGTSEVSVLELTSAYGVFANKGIKTDSIAIKHVEDNFGNVVLQNTPEEKPVLDEVTNYLMVDMMEAVVNEGTGKRARVLNKRIGAKTGTTDKYVDGWFVGYTPSLTVGVWVGLDERVSLGEGAYGEKVAGSIWVDFMKDALKNEDVEDFSIPDGIVFKRIDAVTGLLASPQCKDVLTEAFRKGTEPQQTCDKHQRQENFLELDNSYTILENNPLLQNKDLNQELDRL